MGSHRQIRRRRVPGIRGLVLRRGTCCSWPAACWESPTAWLVLCSIRAGERAPGLRPGAGGNRVPAGSSDPQSTSSGTERRAASGRGVHPARGSGARGAGPPRLPSRSASPTRRRAWTWRCTRWPPDSGTAESRNIVPPETMDGYWLTPFGTPGAGSGEHHLRRRPQLGRPGRALQPPELGRHTGRRIHRGHGRQGSSATPWTRSPRTRSPP